MAVKTPVDRLLALLRVMGDGAKGEAAGKAQDDAWLRGYGAGVDGAVAVVEAWAKREAARKRKPVR